MSGAAPLCPTLEELADETWELMRAGLARAEGREPDERVFTDHNFLHLQRRHASEVRVWLFKVSDEALTGADVEWWVGDGDTWIRMLVQAKRLNRRGRYADVGRLIGGGPERQIDRLLDVCRGEPSSFPGARDYAGFAPVYLFYNGPLEGHAVPRDACRDAAVGVEQRGCTIAHARAVRTALDMRRGARALDRVDIAQSMLPWRCLLCCSRRTGPPADRFAAALAAAGGEGPRRPPRESERWWSAPSVERDAAGEDASPVRRWTGPDLPFDPAEAPSDVSELLAAAPQGWRPGGRLLVVTSVRAVAPDAEA